MGKMIRLTDQRCQSLIRFMLRSNFLRTGWPHSEIQRTGGVTCESWGGGGEATPAQFRAP